MDILVGSCKKTVLEIFTLKNLINERNGKEIELSMAPEARGTL